MYHRDHAPPHFHAEYGEYEITSYFAPEYLHALIPQIQTA